ncbi:MAG TPA: hypothetical protein PK200_17460 [Spirochaetota bacterium]|nr:hypothetical protein [Spirochaetota bacterium]
MKNFFVAYSQYGTAIILILLVLLLNTAGLYLRYRFRRKLKGI